MLNIWKTLEYTPPLNTVSMYSVSGFSSINTTWIGYVHFHNYPFVLRFILFVLSLHKKNTSFHSEHVPLFCFQPFLYYTVSPSGFCLLRNPVIALLIRMYCILYIVLNKVIPFNSHPSIFSTCISDHHASLLGYGVCH